MAKRFTIFTLGALLAGVALAGVPISPVQKSIKSHKMETRQKFEKRISQHVASPSTRASYDDLEVIFDAEGTPVYYNLDVVGGMYGEPFEYEGSVATIVYGEDDDVYFYDLIADAGFGTFAKGVKSEGKITVELPQMAYYYENYGYGFLMTLLEVDANGDATMVEGNAEFVVYDDGDIVMDLPQDGDYALGLVFTDDLSDAGLYYTSMVYSPLDEEVAVIPEGVETEIYYFNDGIYGHPVQVAFDNEYLYMQGLEYLLPPFSVVKADLNGNQAIIHQNEFVGVYYSYLNYTKAVELTSAGYQLLDESAVITLDIDSANKVITYAEGSPLLCINADMEVLFELSIYDEFDLKVQNSFAGVPLNPFALDYTDDYLDYSGYYSFLFTIPNVSTDGNVLSSEDLFYRVFIDGDLYEFEEEYDDDLGYNIYDGFGQGSEVPFIFDNGNDFYSWSGADREVGIYIDGISTIGIQSVYKYNGKVTESDIVTLNLETGEETVTPAAVDQLFNSENINVKYYDLSGRQISHPEKGLYIMRGINSKGEVSAKKVMVR
ncbi:MAG: hypothetical protein J1E16_05465 [Muribaculaceae bacterium]|nr:hypothetical protein [Muribaculaceae bacterium]